jgi:hypothetical protein
VAIIPQEKFLMSIFALKMLVRVRSLSDLLGAAGVTKQNI